MAHNQEMASKNKEKWKGKVRILGLSIDNDHNTVSEHVDNKQWTDVEHFHVRNGDCTADKEFGVRGVPHCLMVDKEGKIVFIGHPATRTNLEEDLQTLMDDGKITGPGTSAAGGDDDEGAGGAGKKCAGDEATAIIESFNKSAKEVMEGVKDTASGCPRAFLVLVTEGTYDVSAKSLSYKLSHYQVFVGP